MAVVGTSLFGFACRKHQDLRKWLYIFIFSTFGILSNFLTFISDFFDIFLFMFYSIAILVCTYVIIREYNILFKKDKLPKSAYSLILIETVLGVTGVSLATVILIIDLVLLIRITIKKKTLTYGFICLVVFGALLTIFGNVFINLNVEGAVDFNKGMDLFFTSTLLIAGIVAIIEDRIWEFELKYQESYKKASFYKDLVSHDIKNILQNIRTSLYLISISLKDEEHKEKFDEYNNIIEDQIYKGVELVNNVRSLSLLESIKESLRKFDLLITLNQSVDTVKASFQEKEIVIKINTKLHLVLIEANELLAEVFDNLLGNAIRHNDNDKIEIFINISKQNNFYQLEFLDNGRGIPDNLKEVIFVESINRHQYQKGMGIGLSLVKRIIESYGGTIRVEDKIKGNYHKGSNFIITFPIHEN